MSKMAFVFPGQGSQSVGMLEELIASESLVKATFSEASAVLGYDLEELVLSGPEERLNQTEFTQPALLAASIGLWRLAISKGASKPDMVAGHSLGEYSALVAAGVVEFSDAVTLVQKRGQFMQSAVPLGKGGMAAILGLEDEQVIKICLDCSDSNSESDSESDSIVQAANFNSPGQVVIAGQMDALNSAIEQCKEAGAKRAMALTVSAPFHSRLMLPAADKMREELAKIIFSSPEIPVIQNVHASYEADPDKIRDNLVKQMSEAVLWTGTIEHMAADGVSKIVECGPGKVLAGLNRRIDKSLVSYGINDLQSLEKTLADI